MVKITEDNWYWHHNVSECYYHIQLTIKYRRNVFQEKIEKEMIEIMAEFKERYYIEVQTIGYDKNHVHLLCRFLPKYSGGQVIRLIKSITSRLLFQKYPEIKRQLWGGEFWSDWYYIGTVSGRGDRKIIENYIKNQGREEDIKQLKLFDI
jgi:putative transposase